MTTPEHSNLPAQIADALTGIPKALIPTSVKALDRLVGAAVDIPVAWLAQKKAQIDAQTQAYTLVEKAIADAAANSAGGDAETVQNAVNVLVRKAYRKQINRQSVAAAMVEDLRASPAEEHQGESTAPPPNLDEDWLNVFERYAEDASTERMQNLWGRVLAGEIRKPGRYSMRTLRFLSEFSQADGLKFSDFCTSAFGDAAPAELVKPDNKSDIRDLVYLESSGLIQGASGLGLKVQITFDSAGNGFVREGSLVILLQGAPGESVRYSVCLLTPLGQELLSLLPGRDARAAARRVANAIKSPAIRSALLATISGPERSLIPMEILWQSPPEQVVSPSA
ncbi:DUF2806 domain-containing protein [Sphingomonas sp.]|uniref:DUF2806 domain-containing protein n=1 Tax=Sphingomonas sp. TaxID=28214 RepID=UPI001D5A5E92|nr:DUF2806 domain-containing protein [Sphingomonas sp.]MBX9796397.1 DUF2806 domain-containing protein [Sphingomonas sp.]